MICGATPIEDVLDEVYDERRRQNAKWGEQDHPNGTGDPSLRDLADHHRRVCDIRADMGDVTWRDIATEEFYEALAESDPALLREELIQLAAVAVAWAEAIDRRQS